MQPKWGYLYVIDFGDKRTFKIGYTTKSVTERFNQIAKSSVLMPNQMALVMSFDVMTNVYAVESLMHMKFEDYRINGEWFELNFPELVELYQVMCGLSVRQTLHQRWFEVVPDDHEKYIEHYAISPVKLPYMTVNEYNEHIDSLKIIPDFYVGEYDDDQQK